MSFSPGGGSSNIHTDGDVALSNPANSQVLTYNSTIAKWVNATAPNVNGLVINVLDYGADPTAATDSDAAVANALAACSTGGVVYFPAGDYRFAQTITIPAAITIRGAMGHRYQKWNVQNPGTNVTYLKPHSGSFSDSALMTATDVWGWNVEHLNLDGVNAGSAIDGMLIQGESKGWRLSEMSIKSFTGNGVHTDALSSGYPNGAEIQRIFLDGNNGHGWYSGNSIARNYPFGDSSFLQSESSVNGGDGWHFEGCNNLTMTQTKAEFNSANGYHIIGNVLRTSFTTCDTDRNSLNGFWFDCPQQSGSAAGNQIVMTGCQPSRDGNGTSSSTIGTGPYVDAGYAGVRIQTSDGTSTSVGVVINGLAVRVGRDDTGTGNMSPDYAIYMPRGSRVLLSGSRLYATYQPVYDPNNALWDDFAVEYNTVGFSSYTISSNSSQPSTVKALWQGSTIRMTDATATPINAYGEKLRIDRTTDNPGALIRNTHAGNAQPNLILESSTSGSYTMGMRLPTDADWRRLDHVNGVMEWGDGTARDVMLQRSAAGILNLSTGAFQIGGVPVIPSLNAYKAADTARTSVTSVVADPDLSLTVASGGIYNVSAVIVYDASTVSDLKFKFGGPGSSTFAWGITAGLTSSASASTSGSDLSALTITSTAVLGGIGVGTQVVAKIEGLLIAGGAGAFSLNWAQNSSDATACTIRAGSNLTLRKIN